MHPTDPNALGVPATRPPELDALLHKICIDDPMRPHLATPLGINLGRSPGARWDAASSGDLLLALSDGRLDLREPASTNVARVLADAPAPTHTCTLTALREWAGTDDGICRACGGEGWASGAATCSKCKGDGVVYCDYDHEHNCPRCDGEGKVGHKCSACNGWTRRKIVAAWIGDCTINRCLLASVIHDLPGESVRVGTHPGPGLPKLALYGPGWRLVIAGRTIATDPDAPRLALTPIEGPPPCA